MLQGSINATNFRYRQVHHHSHHESPISSPGKLNFESTITLTQPIIHHAPPRKFAKARSRPQPWKERWLIEEYGICIPLDLGLLQLWALRWNDHRDRTVPRLSLQSYSMPILPARAGQDGETPLSQGNPFFNVRFKAHFNSF